MKPKPKRKLTRKPRGRASPPKPKPRERVSPRKVKPMSKAMTVFAVTTDVYGKTPLVFFPTPEGAADFCLHGPLAAKHVLRVWPALHRYAFAGRNALKVYKVPTREPGADDGEDNPEAHTLEAFGIIKAAAASAGDTLTAAEALSLILAQTKRISAMLALDTATTPAERDAAAFDLTLATLEARGEAGEPVQSATVQNDPPNQDHINPVCGLELQDCRRADPHVHCPECGSTEHVAEDCDMEG